MADMLFPEYLNKGSIGGAVAALQFMLKGAGFDPYNEVAIDCDYGEMTAKAVRRLQEILEVEQDGNFGPQTREALRKRTGLDINNIPTHIFSLTNI